MLILFQSYSISIALYFNRTLFQSHSISNERFFVFYNFLLLCFADTPNSWRTIAPWPAVSAPLEVLVRWQIQLPLPWGVTTRTSVVLHGPLMQINAKAIAYSWAECARKPAASAIRKSRTEMITTQTKTWELQWPQISGLQNFGEMAFSAYFRLFFTLICNTVFENHPKCRIWHFPPIFVLF